jgi:hypothetical protein
VVFLAMGRRVPMVFLPQTVVVPRTVAPKTVAPFLA